MGSHTEHYRSTYPKLKPMSNGWDGLVNTFGNGVGSHNKPLVSRMAKEMLPGLWSFSSTFREFVSELSYSLNDALPVDLNAKGFTHTGVHATWDRLRTCPGYMMNPMSYTLMNNEGYRQSLKLKPGYTPVQRQIAENVWRIIWSQITTASVKITKKSAGGAPRNTSDHVWKHDFAMFVYEKENFEKILAAIQKRDWELLANEFEILFMMYIQKRDQVDTPGKARVVHSKEYALSNGKLGTEDNADKSVVIDGELWDDWSATRARVVHAGPWALNCMLSIVSSTTMKAMFHRFPEVFHINTAEQVTSVVNGNYIFCGDVTEYDRSMSQDALEVCFNTCGEFWDPRLADMARLLMYSAYYARPLDMAGTRGIYMGDPRKMGHTVIAGNRSGHAWTSLIAKVNKVIETLSVFEAMGLPVVGNELRYLEAKGAINLVNNGDDEIVYTPDEALMSKFETMRVNPDVGHYVVKREDGAVFSGMILRLDPDKPLHYIPTPRLHTVFEKIYCNERSIGGIMRPHWYIGVQERVNGADVHPAGSAAMEIHFRLYRDILQPKIGSLQNILTDAMESAKFSYASLSEKDRAVLDDPDKMYYKYTEDEIDPDVLAEVVQNIKFDSFEHIVKSSYKGYVH